MCQSTTHPSATSPLPPATTPHEPSRHRPLLGGIADDFTGATDLANNLALSGMRTLQVIGVPTVMPNLEGVDAVIVALKTRSCPAEKAVSKSLAAAHWLQGLGIRQLYFKYCSTFDSTPEGNIGPVAQALMEVTGAQLCPYVPAFPANGRSVYQGHLFVGDRLLNDSGMQHHPLTPMTDADITRVLTRQLGEHPPQVELLPHSTLRRGEGAARERLSSLTKREVKHVVCDSIDEDDLAVLAEVLADQPLVSGGSGLGQALPAAFRRRQWLSAGKDATRLAPASGATMVLSGSCSRMTLRQVENFLTHHAGFALDPLSLHQSEEQFEEALTFARQQMSRQPASPFLIYASADPQRVAASQKVLGVQQAGELVEQALSKLACQLVSEGVGRLIVAGGETSGAVVSALCIEQLCIGRQVAPGVPWTQSPHPWRAGDSLSLALKSGNFGDEDFFTRAFEVLDTPHSVKEHA